MIGDWGGGGLDERGRGGAEAPGRTTAVMHSTCRLHWAYAGEVLGERMVGDEGSLLLKLVLRFWPRLLAT